MRRRSPDVLYESTETATEVSVLVPCLDPHNEWRGMPNILFEVWPLWKRHSTRGSESVPRSLQKTTRDTPTHSKNVFPAYVSSGSQMNPVPSAFLSYSVLRSRTSSSRSANRFAGRASVFCASIWDQDGRNPVGADGSFWGRGEGRIDIQSARATAISAESVTQIAKSRIVVIMQCPQVQLTCFRSRLNLSSSVGGQLKWENGKARWVRNAMWLWKRWYSRVPAEDGV